MTAIFSLNEWFKIVERGTSGDQVMDILYSWKSQLNERENGLKVLECKWEYQEDDGFYNTQCEYAFYFEDDKDFKWCPYCGKKIVPIYKGEEFGDE